MGYTNFDLFTVAAGGDTADAIAKKTKLAADTVRHALRPLTMTCGATPALLTYDEDKDRYGATDRTRNSGQTPGEIATLLRGHGLEPSADIEAAP